MKINALVVSIQSAKPSTPFGQLAKTPFSPNTQSALVRVVIPEDVPDTAIVTKADLVYHTRSTLATSTVFTMQQNSTGWLASKVTWNNKPALTGTAIAQTVPSTVDGTEVRISLTSHAQQIISGATANRGWRLTTSVGAVLYGSVAGKFQPYLDLEYTEPLEAPTDLSPNGAAVSVAAPTLTFTVPDDVIAVQVQIDPAANETAPAWDSGLVTAGAGLFDPNAWGYPGLALGSSTSWRARAQSSSRGWTEWSAWADFSRVAKVPGTITSPGATTGDRTPPITWTAPGQVSWRVQLLDAVTGAVIDDSERTTSADTAWTPTKGLKKVGNKGRVRLMLWDAVDRVATPGDPTYSETTFDFELVAIDTAPGVGSLSASQVGPTPVVRLTWAPTPMADNWQPTRDGEWIGDLIDGTVTEFYDYGADPFTQHVYQVLAVTDTGLVSPNGPTATIVPRPAGVWLMDEDTGKKVLIGDAEVTTSMSEQAVLHPVLGNRPPVRRRSGTPPPSGGVAGFLFDGAFDDFPAETLAKRAMQFKDNGQGHVYRLAWGSWNLPVTIGDMTVDQALLDGAGRPSYDIRFSWWATGDDLPWED